MISTSTHPPSGLSEPDHSTGPFSSRMLYAGATVTFLASAGATIHLCRAMSGGMPMPGDWEMSMAWMKMPGQTWPQATVSFIGIWLLMMIAMMLPCFTLMLVKLRDMRSWLPVSAGYFGLWTIIGAVVYPIGIAIGAAEMHWSSLARQVPLLTGAALVLAGCFQFTPWKARSLANCRDGDGCSGFSGEGSWRAIRHGIDLGRRCFGCCGNWMLVLLVTDVMGLTEMALVTLAITIERVPPCSRKAAPATGGVCIALGAVTIGKALFG